MPLSKIKPERACQLSFGPDHENGGSVHWKKADFDVLKIWVQIPSGSLPSVRTATDNLARHRRITWIVVATAKQVVADFLNDLHDY